MRLLVIFCTLVPVTSFLVGLSRMMRSCSTLKTRSFVSKATPTTATTTTALPAEGNKDRDKGSYLWNPLQELSDMMSNFDDVIDDFLNKRMGNGEIFYGQRKYKPSGRENTTGRYTGMGMSDKVKIDIAREYKEEQMEMRRLREQGLRPDD